MATSAAWEERDSRRTASGGRRLPAERVCAGGRCQRRLGAAIDIAGFAATVAGGHGTEYGFKVPTRPRLSAGSTHA